MGCGGSSDGFDNPSGGGGGGGDASLPQFRAPRASRGRWNDLMEQAERGNVGGVQGNIGRYDVNAGDENCWTALLEACEKRHQGVVDCLLANRANPNIADKKGWTPIMAAAEGGNANIARSLLNAGAKVEYQDQKGWTCIMEAAERGNFPMVQTFVGVASVSTLNTKDRKGWSAFMAAVEGGNLECVKLLWTHGAEHHTEYQEGSYSSLGKTQWTAIKEAQQKGHRDIVAYLQPIFDAEENLKKMIETDDWKVEDALLYMERAQQVMCLKELVGLASVKMRSRLEEKVCDQANPDREKCFDYLINLADASGNNNPQNNNNVNFTTDNPNLKIALIEIARGRLAKATQQNTVAAIKWAISSAVKSDTVSDLPEEMAKARSAYTMAMEIPADWDVDSMVAGFDGTGRMIAKKAIDDPGTLAELQEFVNGTIRRKYTRDRRGQKVPDALKVLKLVSIQNEQIFKEYSRRVTQIPQGCPLPDKMPKLLTGGGASFLPLLNSNTNEAWLWHGTNQVAADAITTEDFRLNLAGSNAGTLYGPGIYLADSVSKSDEYTAPNPDGIRCLLLCRVALGRVLYTDAVSPDTQDLTQKCLSKEFDSVLGDREACRGTFKELIVFDDDLVYPEYIVYYQRVMYSK